MCCLVRYSRWSLWGSHHVRLPAGRPFLWVCEVFWHHVWSVHRFFFLFRQGFAPFVAKLLVINQINMHTVVLETLISYCFFDNISHTVVTVCKKKQTTTTTTTKKDRENRPSTPWFAVFKCFLLTTFSPISSFSLLQKESKIDAWALPQTVWAFVFV